MNIDIKNGTTSRKNNCKLDIHLKFMAIKRKVTVTVIVNG